MNITQLKAKFKKGEFTKPEFIRKALDCHRALFNYVDIVRTTDVNEICISDDGVLFVIDGGISLFCPPDESRVVPLEVMNFDKYEPEETRVMDMLSENARHLLDIGANIGWYSVRFAKRLPEAKIFSFEPMPTSYSYLQRNVAKNDVGTQVFTFNYGLSDCSGVVEFFVPLTNGTNASLKNVAGEPDAVAVTALTLTLDQWVANQNVAPDFIKCDVEGAEFLVFRGGRDTLAKYRPVVFTELLRKWSKPFGYHPNDLIGFFAELGYLCFAVGSMGARRTNEITEQTVETNYCFLHSKAHASLVIELEGKS